MSPGRTIDVTVRTDVLVIGGGATGTGLTRDLALRGVDVTLVDRGGLASGTSSRSHGLLHSGARYAEADRVGAEECIEESRILKSIAGHCIRDTGGLFVQLEGDDPDYFDEKHAACQEIGIPTEVLTGEDARERVPDLSEAVERVMIVPDGVIAPSRLVAANAADAREHGARILPHAPVEEITVEDGTITGVAVGGAVNEAIEAEYVVNATGAWAEKLAAMAGVDVQMQPNRGVMISVEYEGLEPVLNRCRDPDDGDIIVPHKGEVVLGTTSVDVDDPDAYPTEEWEIDAMFEECAAMLPAVADAKVIRTWWGIRPLYAPDEEARGGRGISRGFFLLDHADADDGVENFASIVGGKLTTYRQMAETAADLVCEKLEVEAACQTHVQPLVGVDDPAQLDAYVAEFDSQGPTDEDVVSQPVDA